MEITRRQFLKGSLAAGTLFAAGGAGVLLTPKQAQAFYVSPKLRKFIQPMRRIGVELPLATSDGTVTWPGSVVATHYTIDIRQFQDQLHPSLGPTTLWGYGQGDGITFPFKHLGGPIAAARNTPVQVTFQNWLPTPHILPVDTSAFFPDAVLSHQNAVATHLHGGFVPWISDGGPFDWWLPSGTTGPSFLNNAVLNPGASANQAEYYYPNQQSARLMWYHDHAHDITRLNAYAGIATGYVLYDNYETVTLATANHLPGPTDPRTMYMVFQDKTFVDAANIAAVDPTWPGPATTGSLWYPHVYDPSRWTVGPAPAGPPPDPSVVAEAFGDTMLVNGLVFPYLDLQPRQYRIRMLNACNARFLRLRLVYAKSTNIKGIGSAEPASPITNGPAFVQIGNEGGFLHNPVMLNGPGQPLLLLAPAERADFIVDLRAVAPGTVLLLYNDAPAPFPAGDPRNDYHPGNPSTPTATTGYGPNTRTLLQIRVFPRTGGGDAPISLPSVFSPTDPFLVYQKPGVPIVPKVSYPSTAPIRLTNGTVVNANYRFLTLNEGFDDWGRLIQTVGTNTVTNYGGTGSFGRPYASTPTEIVSLGTNPYEIWEILNLTGDTHPMHFHLVNVQILSRQPFNAASFTGLPTYTGPATAPDANERGWKETVRMNPGEVTRVFMQFALPTVPFTVPQSPRINSSYGIPNANEYVYHCHILEHEEHDMMRPLVIIP